MSKLGDWIIDCASGPFGSNLKVECFIENGFPIIDGANLKGVTVTDNITKFVTEEKARSLGRSIAKRHDVVVTISGTLGQIAYIPDNSKYEEYLCSQRQFRVTFDESIVDIEFLTYYFHTTAGKKKILSFANFVGVPALSQPIPNFKNIEVDFPDIETQHKIACVLKTLDAKIANNNAICADLEAMTKLLYDYWFVQFDFPDENGKPYKSSGGKMVWNEKLKRKIPEGWEVKSIKSLCSVISGYPFDSDTYDKDGKYHVLTIKNIQNGYIETVTDSNVCDIPSDIPSYDILSDGDILMSLTGNVGRVGILCGDNYLLNQRASVIRPESNNNKWFLYALFRSEEIFTQIQRIATGTSQKNVSPTDIGNLCIPYSDKNAKRYHASLVSVIQKIIDCNRENQQLSSLRDFLLPMLMNGQVKVG